MKFDFAIGNPPYQDTISGENETFAPPVYNKFLDSAYQIADRVEMIHPARFLSNAGSTPKEWNKKMLDDEHLKILYYEQDSSKVFGNTDIKGGVTVTYRDLTKNYGAIEVFSPYGELRSINSKVSDVSKTSIKEIIYTQNRFNLDNLYLKHPEYKSVIGSEGKDRRFRNNIFEKIPSFLEKAANESDIAVIGVIKNKRYWRYIDKELMDLEHENLMKWKVIVPRANGKGVLGEILSSPIILEPNQGYTQTFIGIGAQIGNPDSTVIAISGDGGMQMNIQEFATAVLEELPLILCVFNNTYLGMVRQWQKLFYGKRYSMTDLRAGAATRRGEEHPPKYTPDFVKLAESYGAKGIRVTEKSEMKAAFEQAKANRALKVPTLIEFMLDPEVQVYPMVRPGGTLEDLLMD